MRSILSDGYAPVDFLRLVPYYDTGSERVLKEANRFKMVNDWPSFSFTEPLMDDFCRFFYNNFSEWLIHGEGLKNLSCWARSYYPVYLQFIGKDKKVLNLRSKLKSILKESNRYILDEAEELCFIFESGTLGNIKQLEHHIEEIRLNHRRFVKRMRSNMQDMQDHVFYRQIGLDSEKEYY